MSERSDGKNRAGIAAVSLVATLTILNIVNYLDRTQFNTLAEPIRRDLGLNDAQMGLLQGLAFALVFSIFALPVARIADRGKQKKVLGWSVLIWSLMTAGVGLAGNFSQMVIARMGVALGEAGVTPASHSLIMKYVPTTWRGRAIAIFGLGLPLGSAFGAVLGGHLSDLHGWRWAFLITGPATLALLIPVLLFVPGERIEGGFSRAVAQAQEPMFSAISALWMDPRFRSLVYGYGTACAYGYAKGAFFAILLMRKFEFTGVQTGLVTGLTAGLIGSSGLLLGGYLYDFCARRFPDNMMRPTVVALSISAIIYPVGFLSDNWIIAVVLISIGQLLYLFIMTPTFAAGLANVAPEKRASASSIIHLCGGLPGAALGPLIAGAISDRLAPAHGAESIGLAMASIAFLLLISAWSYHRVDRISARMKAASEIG